MNDDADSCHGNDGDGGGDEQDADLCFVLGGVCRYCGDVVFNSSNRHEIPMLTLMSKMTPTVLSVVLIGRLSCVPVVVMEGVVAVLLLQLLCMRRKLIMLPLLQLPLMQLLPFTGCIAAATTATATATAPRTSCIELLFTSIMSSATPPYSYPLS